MKHLLAGSLVVTQEQVAQACRYLLHTQGLVVEGAGAVSLPAAWQQGAANVHRVCIVSGGNVDAGVWSQWVAPAEPTSPTEQADRSKDESKIA